MGLTKHHRKPRFLNGTDNPDNISKVPDKKHKAYHLLFNHQHPVRIARILNEVWIDPHFEFIVRVKK